jgi:hypothetical protein
LVRPLSLRASQIAADQLICAVQMRFSISCASMTSEFGELARPRTRSHEATDIAGGSGYVDRPPPNALPLGAPPPRKRPGRAADDTPQLITSSTRHRQRLNRCSWQRVSERAEPPNAWQLPYDRSVRCPSRAGRSARKGSCKQRVCQIADAPRGRAEWPLLARREAAVQRLSRGYGTPANKARSQLHEQMHFADRKLHGTALSQSP